MRWDRIGRDGIGGTCFLHFSSALIKCSMLVEYDVIDTFHVLMFGKMCLVVLLLLLLGVVYHDWHERMNESIRGLVRAGGRWVFMVGLHEGVAGSKVTQNAQNTPAVLLGIDFARVSE